MTRLTYGEPVVQSEDILERLDALIPRDGTGMPLSWTTRAVHSTVLLAARDEIARLRAGGCARGQRTTQYCAEAVDALSEADRLRARVAALELASRELLDTMSAAVRSGDFTLSGSGDMAEFVNAAINKLEETFR